DRLAVEQRGLAQRITVHEDRGARRLGVDPEDGVVDREDELLAALALVHAEPVGHLLVAVPVEDDVVVLPRAQPHFGPPVGAWRESPLAASAASSANSVPRPTR